MEFALTSPEVRDAAVMRAHEADYTPPRPVVALLREVRQRLLPFTPTRFLDPSAGAGVWGQVVAGLWPGVTSVGVEPREVELEHVARNYSITALHRFEQFVAAPCFEAFGLIATNPPFTPAFTRESSRPSWIELVMGGGLLHPYGVLAFLGRSQWGQSEEAWDVLRLWSPALQLRLGGRLAFRGGSASDSADYSLWCWTHTHAAACRESGQPQWATVQLPPMPAGDRQWQDLPGTYPLPPEVFR